MGLVLVAVYGAEAFGPRVGGAEGKVPAEITVPLHLQGMVIGDCAEVGNRDVVVPDVGPVEVDGQGSAAVVGGVGHGRILVLRQPGAPERDRVDVDAGE